MPLKKDLERKVDVKDINTTKYCSHCYKDGKFTQPDCTLEQMEVIVYDYVSKDMNMPKWIAKMAKNQTKKLERWAK